MEEALSSLPVMANFDPALPTISQTDVSYLHRIGHALLKEHSGGQLRIVQCESRFLTNIETHYANIELEILAVIWAASE